MPRLKATMTRQEIKAARLAAGMTQIAFSQALGVAYSYYTKVELGYRTVSPSMERRVKLFLGEKAS